MFHVRRLTAQTNLSLLKQSANYLIKPVNYSKNSITPSNIELEQIIRIDHTETPEHRKINISQSCIKRLRELQNENKYLRISVDSGGCSGFEYKFSLDILKEDDKVIEEDNCKILVDKESVEFIKGSTIDFYEELIRSGFRVINNPNSEQACSCGSSFSPKI